MGRLEINNLFGTEFEVSLRIPLLTYGHAMSEDRICALDFITTYAEDFGLSANNINGNGCFRKCEYASRQLVIRKAIRSLVLKGILHVSVTGSGFIYSLTESGYSYADKFCSTYAFKYYNIAQEAYKRYQGCTDDELVSELYQAVSRLCQSAPTAYQDMPKLRRSKDYVPMVAEVRYEMEYKMEYKKGDKNE